MIDWLIGKIENRVVAEVLNLLFFGGGVFAFFKITIVMYSTRIFSFYWIYRDRKKFENHKIFLAIDSLRNKKDIAIGVLDPVKKDIIVDVFEIELIQLKKVLKMNLRRLFKRNIKQYTGSFSDFKIDKIISMFYDEFISCRELVEESARSKFTIYGGMTQQDFNRFWKLYLEIFQDYEIIMMESLHKYRNHKDIYKALFFILDDFLMIVEIMYKSLAHRFNRLNGRSYGISYKGNTIGQSDDYNQ